MDLGKSMSRGVSDFSLSPVVRQLTDHRLNNIIVQQAYSPGGSKPTGEDENHFFTADFHRDFNISDQTLLLRIMDLGKSMSRWERDFDSIAIEFPKSKFFHFFLNR